MKKVDEKILTDTLEHMDTTVRTTMAEGIELIKELVVLDDVSSEGVIDIITKIESTFDALLESIAVSALTLSMLKSALLSASEAL